MDLSKIPTYDAGILQSKVHRALRVIMARMLKKYGLTMMQWFILGLVLKNGKKGVRISDLAEELDTTLAFVTNNVNLLESKGYVDRRVHQTDTRVRVITIDPKARKKVRQIENTLREELRKTLYSKIDPEELAIYIKVLNQLSSMDR